MNQTDDRYFASLPRSEIAGELLDRVDHHDQFLHTSGLLGLWRLSVDTYNHGFIQASLQEAGTNDEFTTTFVNHYRNILKHMQTTMTSSRPAFEPEAINSEFRSRLQVKGCRGLLDYYFWDKDFERHINKATEGAILLGERFVSQEWDYHCGKIVETEEVERGEDEEGLPEVYQRPVYEGDVAVEVHNPQDVIRDYQARAYDDLQWLIVRKRRNKWDLAALYPEHHDAIASLPPADSDEFKHASLSTMREHQDHQGMTDQVYYFCFYHKPTPAVPFGRVVHFVDDETVLSDTSMDSMGYDEIPLYRESAGDAEDCPYGYSFAFDLLALQDAVNLLHSTITTNQAAFGVQSVQCMGGQGIKASRLTRGLTLFEYADPQGKLESLNLTDTPQEIFKYVDQLVKDLETLSGVNSVARGNPEASLESGAALALVQAQHIEFSRDLQRSYVWLVSKLGTGLVHLFRKHVGESERLAAIAGRPGRSYMMALKGTDLSNITRVKVSMGNHLARTPAGRLNIAEQLLQIPGAITTPEQYMTVLESGRLESLTHGPSDQLDLIQAENEAIMKGETPQVMIHDNHLLHIQEHTRPSADMEARKDPGVMAAEREHVMLHITALANMPPELAAILKQPVLAAQQPGMSPPPVNGPPPPAPAELGPAKAGDLPLPAEAPANPNDAPTPPGGEVAVNPLPGGGAWNPQTGGAPSPPPGGVA